MTGTSQPTTALHKHPVAPNLLVWDAVAGLSEGNCYGFVTIPVFDTDVSALTRNEIRIRARMRDTEIHLHRIQTKQGGRRIFPLLSDRIVTSGSPITDQLTARIRARN
jgi:hypothetical protein